MDDESEIMSEFLRDEIGELFDDYTVVSVEHGTAVIIGDEVKYECVSYNDGSVLNHIVYFKEVDIH